MLHRLAGTEKSGQAVLNFTLQAVPRRTGALACIPAKIGL